MVKRHLKRLAIPNSWNIKKKGLKFTTRPDPGAHSLQLGMPINVIIRDMLKYCKTNSEAKKILNNGEVLIDGKARKEFRFIAGFMDAISIPKLKENYRIVLNKKGKLYLLPIPEQEAKLKVCRIIGKTLVKGRVQLNLLDSRNILVDKDEYKVGDSLLIAMPEQEIKEHLKLEKGATIFILKGKKVGVIGNVEDIIGRKVICKHDNILSEIPFDYAFVVGKNKSAIKIDEEIKK